MSKKERAVIVCTEHRGVFFGYAKATDGDVIHLTRARMAIYWGTTRGVMELAETGPTSKSRISATDPATATAPAPAWDLMDIR